MVRWMTALLFAGCLTAAGLATEAAHAQDAAVQNAPAKNSATEPATPGQTAEAPTAKSGFPLDDFKEFSAVMVGSMLTRDDREGYVYRSGDLLRSEGPLGKAYFVTDLTKLVTYGQTRLGCVKDAHAYFRSWPFIASRSGHTSERVTVGKETVDGRVCVVEDVTITGKDLIQPTKLRFWEPEEWHGFPIKVEDLNSKGARVVRFKDVVLGSQDPTLFLYPKDCEGSLPQPPKKTPAMSPKLKPPVTPPPVTPPSGSPQQ